MPKKPNNLVKSVDRVVNILEALSGVKTGLGVTELSNTLGLPKSSVSRLLSTLVYRRLVKQDSETGKYRLGIKLFEFAGDIFNNLEIRTYVKPYLQELVEKVNETVHLVIYDDGEVIYIDKFECSNPIRMYSQLGKRAPVHCTSVGKAIIAFKAETEIDRVIKEKGLPVYNQNTITDPEEFKKCLQKIRERGYALDQGELQSEVRCVAAPLFNYSGEVVASISVAGPEMRINNKMDQLIKLVRQTASRISANLGHKSVTSG